MGLPSYIRISKYSLGRSGAGESGGCPAHRAFFVIQSASASHTDWSRYKIAVFAPVYNIIVHLFVAPLGIVVGPDYCLPFRSTERDREVENEGTHCYFVGLVIVCACT